MAALTNRDGRASTDTCGAIDHGWPLIFDEVGAPDAFDLYADEPSPLSARFLTGTTLECQCHSSELAIGAFDECPGATPAHHDDRTSVSAGS